MPKMQAAFDGDVFTTNKVLRARLVENEAALPLCSLQLHIDDYNAVKEFETCDVKYLGKPFFKGKISSFFIENQTFDVLLEVSSPPDPPEIKTQDETRDLFAKFRAENPDILVPISRRQMTRIGDAKESSIITPNATILNLDNEIIHDSLSVAKFTQNAISRVVLEVSASWVSRYDGDLDISSSIHKRFAEGKINTLTPAKLTDSWPRFGDKISRNTGNRATKYFVGYSRLAADPTLRRATPPININEDISQFSLRHEFFDGNLTLSWSFDQFMSETVRSVIVNKFAKNNKKETIKINLKNVQEYLPSANARSFFASDLGHAILDDIYKSIGNYIALSLRNIELSFEVPHLEKTEALGSGDWISVQGHVAKITKLEHEITPHNSIIKVTASGLGNAPPALASHAAETSGFVATPQIAPLESLEFQAKDIIHDITIQNDGTTQFSKLLAFIDAQKSSGKINKMNFKSMISEFLTENQTTIKITAKPLKTEHCKKITIDTQEVEFLQRA